MQYQLSQSRLRCTTMSNSTNASRTRPTGLTSCPFHVALWTLAGVGIIGSVLVIIWRCTRRNQAKFHLNSVMVVCLAISNILFCTHYLLREVMLIEPVFRHNGSNSYAFEDNDTGMCTAINFLTYASCISLSSTSVAIALHTFLSLCGAAWRKTLSVTILLTGWFVSLAVATFTTYELGKNGDEFSLKEMSVEEFSLTIIFGCVGGRRLLIFPVVVTAVNALCATFCCMLYVATFCKIREITKSWRTYTTSGSDRRSHVILLIRLVVMVVLNLIWWWPACVLYWLSYFSNRSQLLEDSDLKIVEFSLISTVVVSVLNPIIYTVASEPFTRSVKRFLACFDETDTTNEMTSVTSDDNKPDKSISLVSTTRGQCS